MISYASFLRPHSPVFFLSGLYGPSDLQGPHEEISLSLSPLSHTAAVGGFLNKARARFGGACARGSRLGPPCALRYTRARLFSGGDLFMTIPERCEFRLGAAASFVWVWGKMIGRLRDDVRRVRTRSYVSVCVCLRNDR